ncbi:TetR/AcrR family transcriptional regulator [Luteipulveratus mongoliensis]|uniref:HTH tetR-type domain-containing protein n=1 Tax=Luteipulveratus mongoliensis TaxID=571913 RepID=A0A0K1JLS6_9MICO|nr:TetR/AcrR family transcriptional regulator [Luteipulveratus mongoliensis]AKU17533.1 hypothetical protein VV02_19605 [Luteipulveratus mongoliensis]
MASQETWLDEGLSLLAQDGVAGLRIDRLAARLKLSKGSFYHHFDSMPGYKTALLAHFEATRTTRFIDLADEAGGASARERLDALHRIVVDTHEGDVAIEVAMRAWASLDAEAHAAMERIDGTRLGYLERLWNELTDADTAHDTARIVYLVLIGAQHLAPALPQPELDHLFAVVAATATPR